ncbi:antibiotic biosynthesis monooxygenase [Streptomyces sp. NBC_00996]|uniref:antibiotic biosynthesis monooxygenase n=1 Tax=Streptomyces sp. NBC_00996 TaxID=2903710 RepID=UPI0038635BA8|nr:antibiotic biosynthesis monooxygenase [Streptomyces sp. NBC_00996]
MVKVGLFVRIEAKPGHEAAVEAQLAAALAEVEQEADTTVWLALRLGPSTFAVVDAFPHEAGRQAHLEAGVARLAEGAAQHLAVQPKFEYTEIVAAKIPSHNNEAGAA